ncbi:MAG: DUF4956 domain-containing protein [Bacteroidales bacterium]|nr:DUF4956 domain-containing protein [Bacteroidales bacterium]
MQNFDPDIAREFGGDAFESGFLGVPLVDMTSLWTLLLRFAFHFLVCWVIVRCFYYPKSRRNDYYFTFMLFAVTIFLLIIQMDNMKMAISFALGLFAIFGMIRYRTETLKVREMTYLFIIIGISIINGLALTVSYIELLVTNALFIISIWLFESNILASRRTDTKIILYDKIENAKHGREDELIADLKERTGLDITEVEIGHIDFLRDVAFVKVTYKPFSKTQNTINNITKLKDFQ